ncbi:MAG: hypothetical protein EOP06_06950 [Proteobacteria bacterium]|nr:MAG: hypothetical protein EOP06_06950 [Pseudomonadota bacterium]
MFTFLGVFMNFYAPSWSRRSQVIAIFAVLSHGSMLFAETGSALRFKAESYELSSDSMKEVDEISGRLSKEPSLSLVIKEQSQSLKPASRPYIIERNRSLRLFQALVRKGVDPARISYEPTPMSKGSPIELELKEGSPLGTSKVLPQADANASEGLFTINFASGSAEPLNLDEGAFKSFLSSVGQPGRDAAVIEGFTDTVGNAAYNKDLGEFRALSVYEKLVRSGLPPYRVDTESKGASNAKRKGDSAADRKVVVRWVVSKAIADIALVNDKAPAEARVKEEPSTPPAPAEALTPPPVAAEEPKEQPPSPSEKSSTLDIVPFAGIIMPSGEWDDHAKNGSSYGLGIGKAFIENSDGELRATLFVSGKSKLSAKESDRDGDVNLGSAVIRADYAFGSGKVRPFVGVGLGYYAWDGDIVQPSSQRKNTGDQKDTGGLVTLGLEWWVLPSLAISPEFTYTKVNGDFSEAFTSAILALRWRI